MNLLRTLATVSGLTLVSRILGFVRDFTIAILFGAGAATDAFFVAFRLPNLLRRMFAEGAFSQAFVPVLAEYKNRMGVDAARALASRVATLLAIIVFLVTVLGILFAPGLIYVSAPGFAAQPEKFALTVELTRIVFPYLFFISLVSLAGGVLNTWGRFAIPAVTPALLNISFIAMALFAAPFFEQPVHALAWAVFLGGVLQLCLQLPALHKIGMLPKPTLDTQDEGVRRVLRLMLPMLLGVSVAQISLLINTVFASYLQSGSVSWLYYADRLMEFPAGLLGVALGTILLPSLSKSHASSDAEEFSSLLDWGLRLTFLLTLPAALALAILATPLLATLFQHGAFTPTDVLQTRQALIAYSVGLTGMILVKILAPAFYARQNVKTPVKIALFTLFATQLMNLAFIGPFKHAGLALSIGLAACLNAGLLFYGLRKRKAYLPSPGWAGFGARLIVALVALGAVLWMGMGSELEWLHASASWRVTHLTGLVIAGALTYFVTLWLLGFRLQDFKKRTAL